MIFVDFQKILKTPPRSIQIPLRFLFCPKMRSILPAEQLNLWSEKNVNRIPPKLF